MSIPQIDILPVFFFTSPPKILIKVDLPAPLGPSNPCILPCLILILKFLRALTSPLFPLKVLLTSFASIE